MHPFDRLSPTEQHALALDGVIWRSGSLVHHLQEPPLLPERAHILRRRLPDWATIAGVTAGWLWTGLGRPEPFDLIAPSSPALSPIVRNQWRPRSPRRHPLETMQIRGLQTLTREATASDLLVCRGDDDVVASQLYQLSDSERLGEIARTALSGRRHRGQDRVRQRVSRVRQWWSDYPVVTR